jgi:hypothetical protein
MRRWKGRRGRLNRSRISGGASGRNSYGYESIQDPDILR